MTPITAVIVSSSPLTQSRLTRDLRSIPEVHLCGQAGDLSGAYILVEQKEPQLVILGTELVCSRDFDGLLAMFRVMGIRWMRIASNMPVTGPAAHVPVLNPTLPSPQLLIQIEAAMASAAVVPTRLSRTARTQPAVAHHYRPDRCILIGSSTGGIDALMQVLSAFPADCPPTAIVQHTGAAFSDSLIRLLGRCCAASVVAAQSGIAFLPGTVVVGAGSRGHLRLQAGTPPRTLLAPGDPVSGHLPSVDELFRSATGFARNVTAVVLTGMGRDGAQGLLALRQAGASTIAQDEATSVVYGMPRTAWEIGAAEVRLPIDQIGPELLARSAERPAGRPTARSAIRPNDLKSPMIPR